MKTLIITAHPSSIGFTHAIAGVLKAEREKTGGVVEILDLYKTELKQDFLNFERMRDLKPDPVRDVLQKKIKEADEFVFIHPIWWMAQPAIMKNFIDQNFLSRFAYQYIDGKRVGLLKGKTARVYVTCDGPIWAYMLLGFPFATIWIVVTLLFCGIGVDWFSITRMLPLKTDEQRTEKLERIKNNANKKSIVLRLLSIIGNL